MYAVYRFVVPRKKVKQNHDKEAVGYTILNGNNVGFINLPSSRY